MAGSGEKLERLLNLTAALLETPRPLTADEIADRVYGYPEDRATFRRMFERDKDDLRDMGIPIVLQDITGTDPPTQGYRIPKDQYELRDPGLEPDELAALHLAASAVRVEGIDATPDFWKLGGVPLSTRARRQQAATTREVAAIPVDERLVDLFAAVADRSVITFTYRGERRVVDPYRLDFHRGRWYVGGHDHDRGATRVFRLDRIDGDIEVGARHSFERPADGARGVALDPWELGEGEPMRGRVLVDPDHAALAVSMLGADTVTERRDDGSIVVELPVTNPEGFRAFVLGFLDHAEVIGPPELRDDLVAWLRAIAGAAS